MSDAHAGAGGINQPLYLSIHAYLEHRAERSPEALALLAPERAALTYGRLYEQVEAVLSTLRAMGIGRHDRVAVVLPNGPEMALAFLAVAAGAVCAPLNPAYSTNEFEFYLRDMRASALMIQADMDSPARAVAGAHGIGIIELSPRLDAEAGLFALVGQGRTSARDREDAQPTDVALVLHTSGSTSRPKIVPLTHFNLCTAAHNMRLAFELVESDRCLNVLPLFHLHALQTVILASLVAGASMVCPRQFSAPQFFAWLEAFRPTWYTAVPTIHQELVDHAACHRLTVRRGALRLIRSGSAALPPRVRAALIRTFHAPVVETYGATEAAGLVTCNPPPAGKWKVASAGVPVGPEVAIMGPAGDVLSVGETGEIVVRGPTVMQGYDNDPAANRIAFTRGWFRSGDAGYVDADGYLYVTGRFKDVINRGGSKVAPQEVDDVLGKHPAVAQAVTFAVPHVRWGEDVVSAVVLHRHTAATAQELRRFVAARLADFKVPSRVLVVESIPLGPVGKPQRHRLAEQLGLARSAPAPSAFLPTDGAPRTPLEEVLAGIWATVLDLEDVRVDDNFFQRGGDSLVAVRLLSRIRDATQVELSFRSFFEAPTVAEMARHIATVQQAVPPALEALLEARPRHAPLAVSSHQQRLWFLEQLGLTRHAYSLLEAIRLGGPLQVTALEQSFLEIVRRHEVLRTTFTHASGELRQVIGVASPLPVRIEDLRDIAPQERDALVLRLAQAEVQQPFDLARGPLLRVTLLRFADDEHVLLLTMHHIVSDGWSEGLFWREFATLYEGLTTGRSVSLPALAVQYADFARWQQRWLQGEAVHTQLAYWKRQLAGAAVLQLPTDHPRPAVQTFRGARQYLTLPPTLTRDLKTLSQRHGVTLFMTLLAAFQTLLHRYTGQDDIVVGSLMAHRDHIELEHLIGFFVNTLVLRTDLSGDPGFQELLVRVREVTLGAYSHKDVPYEKLLEELRPSRDLSRNPLFQVLCVLHNTPQSGLELPGLTVWPLEIDPGTARFDLTLDWFETPEGLRGRFEYSTDLFEAATIARMARHVPTLLEGIVAAPERRLSQLPILAAEERRRILVEWNATTAPSHDEPCIHGMFETRVARTPDAVAVVCGEASLTYRDLNRRANQVAHYLQACGVGLETVVGLCLERSLAMVVGLLGILKAGAAYVPLDPTSPPGRLAGMLADAQPAVVLTQERLATALSAHGAQQVCLDAHWATIARYSEANPVSGAAADNLAYLLYTSGSTGEPKGVLGVHGATLNTLAWLWRAFPFASHEVCCQHISLGFTDSVQELLAPLLQGVPTILMSDTVLQALPHFVETLAAHRVTRLILVPSLLRTLLDTYDDLQDRLPDLQLWFAGGEALSNDLWRRFRARLPQRRLINLYGTSEASADTTWYEASQTPEDLAYVPIGRPIANTQVYVLDQYLQPVPIGIPGVLYVGGAGLSRGYHNRPGLTAERFTPHPLSRQPGARLYNTGDVVRYRADGSLEYVGRSDHQVKMRGIRIELGEVEAALARHPAVRQAVVVVREEVPGEPRLIAYVVPAPQPGPPSEELRRVLATQLPAAMIPSAFVMLEALPLTSSGKVNRRALPEPEPRRPTPEDRYVAPRTPLERQVAAVWGQLLGLERVGIQDDFFALGGHSLLAMRLLFGVRDATQVDIPLVSFFETPTVRGMVALIEAAHREAASRTEPGRRLPPIVPVPRHGTLPASIAQEHFWLFEQLLPGLPVFNISAAVRLQGGLDLAALEQSFDVLIARHETLRTTFDHRHGSLVQVIAPACSMSLTVRDLGVLPEPERQGAAELLRQEEAHRPFELTRGPLLRACLLRLSAQEHILLVTLHHIICDGWSLGVFMRELAAAYDALAAGGRPSLPALPIQYADFASWQRRWRHHAALEAQLAYWRTQLREPWPVLELSAHCRRGTVLASRTARQNLELPGALSEAVQRVSRQERCTPFVICLTAFKILLYAYTGQADLRVATMVANRTQPGTAGLIGLVANTVILRTDLGGNPTQREVLQRVRAATLAAYANQDLPFEELVRTLERERPLQRPSLCQVMMIWHHGLAPPRQGGTRTLRFEPPEQDVMVPRAAVTTFDLILILRQRPQGLTGTLIYNTDLFDAGASGRILDDFQDGLARLSAEPGRALAACQPRQRS